MTQEFMKKDESVFKTDEEYQKTDFDINFSQASKLNQKVRVVHGANDAYFENLEGKTVGYVRKSLRDVFNIPIDAVAVINGETVDDNYIFKGSESLDFNKESGVKGI